MGLLEEIEAAEAHLAQLRRQAATATCAEVGHRWKHIGGSNAGCGDDCGCSVPVHRCEVCGDCDYGDNAEGAEVRAECAENRSDWIDDMDHETLPDMTGCYDGAATSPED